MAQRLQQPQLHRKRILIASETKASGGSEHLHDGLTRAICTRDWRSAEPNADVLTDALYALVCGFIEPRQPLKFRIERRPFFQCPWLAKAHCNRLAKIGRTGIWRVDIRMKFSCGKSAFDVAKHTQCQPSVLFGFIRKSKNEREGTRNACGSKFGSDFVKHACSLKANFVDRAKNIV